MSSAVNTLPPPAPIVQEGAAPTPCPDCGEPILASYCPSCGEARPEPGGLRLRHLLAEFTEHVADLDFRLLRTVVTLLRRPGQLTRDYVLGRRNRYVRPLALYLLVSGAFFLAMSKVPIHGFDVGRLLANTDARGAPSAAARIMARTGETRDQMAKRVNASPLVHPRATAAFLVPVLALLLAALHVRKRRLVAEHVLFAIHLQTFLLILSGGLLVAAFSGGWVAGRVGRWFGLPGGAQVMRPVLSVIFLAAFVWLLGYVYLALRRVYGHGRTAAFWRAAFMAIVTPMGLLLVQVGLILLVAAMYWP